MAWVVPHSYFMTNEKAGARKAAEWAERITAQQRSGIPVKQFCKEQGLTEYSFYSWRRRLLNEEPVRFALVERGTELRKAGTEPAVELVLASGERLRISAGVDATTLRTVLEALRA